MIFTDIAVARQWFEKQISECLCIGDLHTFCSPGGVLFGTKIFPDDRRVVFSLNPKTNSFLLSFNEKLIAQANCNDETMMNELIIALEIVKKREFSKLKQTHAARILEQSLPLWPVL